MSTTDNEQTENSLELINILLATVIRPTSAPFNSTSYGVTDHQRHVYSIVVENGAGKLSSGSPMNQNPPSFKKQISTNEDGCPDKLKQIQEELKSKTEEVNDITINEFILQFGVNDEEEDSVPYLLGCEGSTFTPSEKLEPFLSYLTIFTLFYAVESSVTPIQSQCITRGKSCQGGTQTIQRSKIIGCHISAISQSMKGNTETKSTLSQYLKKRINTLCPVIMMATVPVCSSCFKFYSTEANQNKKLSNSVELGAATLDDQNRTLIQRKDKKSNSSVNSTTASSESKEESKMRSSVPMVRPDPPPYQIGDRTKSGLRVASNNSTIALELAKYTYKHNGLFVHVPPPKPEFHSKKK